MSDKQQQQPDNGANDESNDESNCINGRENEKGKNKNKTNKIIDSDPILAR